MFIKKFLYIVVENKKSSSTPPGQIEVDHDDDSLKEALTYNLLELEEVLKSQLSDPEFSEDESTCSQSHSSLHAVVEGVINRAADLKKEQLTKLGNGEVHYQAPGLLPIEDEEETTMSFPATTLVHKPTKLRFSLDPIDVYTTYSAEEYDRKVCGKTLYIVCRQAHSNIYEYKHHQLMLLTFRTWILIRWLRH